MKTNYNLGYYNWEEISRNKTNNELIKILEEKGLNCLEKRIYSYKEISKRMITNNDLTSYKKDLLSEINSMAYPKQNKYSRLSLFLLFELILIYIPFLLLFISEYTFNLISDNLFNIELIIISLYWSFLFIFKKNKNNRYIIDNIILTVLTLINFANYSSIYAEKNYSDFLKTEKFLLYSTIFSLLLAIVIFLSGIPQKIEDKRFQKKTRKRRQLVSLYIQILGD